MAVGPFTITAGRSSVADPTSPYMYDNAVIVFRKGGGAGADRGGWTFFLRPFHPLVYAALAGCFLVVLLLLLLLERCHWGLGHDRPVKREACHCGLGHARSVRRREACHWNLAGDQLGARTPAGREATFRWLVVEDFEIVLAGLLNRCR